MLTAKNCLMPACSENQSDVSVNNPFLDFIPYSMLDFYTLPYTHSDFLSEKKLLPKTKGKWKTLLKNILELTIRLLRIWMCVNQPVFKWEIPQTHINLDDDGLDQSKKFSIFAVMHVGMF